MSAAQCVKFYSLRSPIHTLNTTDCFTPSGGGPDPNDCHIIADALRFDGQDAPDFTVPTGVRLQQLSTDSINNYLPISRLEIYFLSPLRAARPSS